MLFSIYPEGGPPRQSGPNPVFIVLGACGGCALLIVLGFIALTLVVYNKSKGMVQAFMQQPKQAQLFLEDLKAHRYAEADALLSPQAQQERPEEALQKLEENTEKRFGSLLRWDTALVANTQQMPPETPMGNRKTPVKVIVVKNVPQRMTYTYRLHYDRGDADAVFSFGARDPLHPTTEIESFQLTPLTSDVKSKPAKHRASEETNP